MEPRYLARFSKDGDAVGEVQQLLAELGGESIGCLDYLKYRAKLGVGVTVAQLNEHGEDLKKRLLSTPGWRDDTALDRKPNPA